MSHAEFDRLIALARKKNQRYDADDRRNGRETPLGALQSLETAMDAIKAGLITGDESCIAEAWVLLETAVKAGLRA